ncbi:SNF2 family N-terminal domain-containing protein [Xylaria bambusicola]|uniref:SNF2 family N-terminal domain-containing protein n=1 Tax=Xylaria bambusicola TaxID=326684 RepID=UPI002007ACCD|nr:SNF2 family N-terminal domain-containing protein [Xylaria bambusicola]KAI0502986.1 SNF2 family N-terminal domain-containing protein [Xylaria bambusicola]
MPWKRRKIEKPITIHPGEPFPNTLLVALRDLALHTQNGKEAANEPSQKRRRLDPVEPIPVLREQFTVSRPTGSSSSPILGQVFCNDAGRYFTFRLHKQDLILQTKAIAPCDTFYCHISIDQNFSNTALAALEVLDLSREDSTQEGALTVLTTISLNEDDGMHHLHFTLTVNFNTATYTLRNARQRQISKHILDVLRIPGPSQSVVDQSTAISPRSFYQAAFMPTRGEFNDLQSVVIPDLKAELYPFQRRAVQWLLMREGIMYDGMGSDGVLQLTEYPRPPKSTLPFSFHCCNDVNGQQYYVSDLYHLATRDVAPFQDAENNLRGGILAEEMGLGKTVEIISLILAHERESHTPAQINSEGDIVLRSTGATLIVTPETLLNQWISEFNKHAPNLLVMKYPGIKVWAKDKTLNIEQHGESLLTRCIDKLVNCDVIITTYSVLQAELHFAVAPPARSMRYEKRHERHTSPLVQIDWWRICLDEAQQIDTGVSSAAKVACLLPRVNAWAVTGTPVKDDPNDLWGLLLFLRYEPFASYQIVWKALLHTHKSLFGPLFNRIAIRHSKSAVRDELRLPSQKRHIVTMPFTAIEEHHYRSQFKALVAKAGLSEQGTPLDTDWDPDDPFVVEFMKKALACLRQTILHPELGSGAAAKVSVYKTLAEHLETMIEHSEASIKSHQRSYLIAKLSKGQLLENTPRVTEALKIWDEVREEVEPIVLEAREELQRALEAARQEQDSTDDSEDEEVPETAKVGDSRRKLRLFLDLQHRVTFFIASAYFQIKSDDSLTQPESDEFKRLEQCETEGYELARKLRREILQEPLAKVSKLLEKLRDRANKQSFVEIPEIVVSDLHGLQSGRIAEDLQNLGASLNEQADVIDVWRETIIQLLLKPLVDAEDEDEITGEEYGNSTMVQDHLMVYTLGLGAILGDRQEALSGLINERIRYETATAEGMAKDGEGHAPEKLLELLQIRQEAKPLPAGQSFRGIISALRELSTTLRHDASMGSTRARVELEIVTRQLRTTQDILTKQNKVAINLEKDLEFFISTMNARVDYYRQLQSVSDNVAPLAPELSSNQLRSWNNYVAQEAELRKKANHWVSNRRHLIHMRDDGSSSNEPCAICRMDDYTIGAITTCGHTFCKECIVQWLRSKYKCPLCKEYQSPSMLSEFTKTKANAKVHLADSISPSLRGDYQTGSGLYSNISDHQRRAIQNVKLHGPSYSSKVDTLIKHLLWLREEDPGAKSIIFTQFRSFLTILGQALEGHRIGFATFSRGGNKALEIQRFKDDPSIECLLMDAKAHSSGLNLVNANHVFLCEPLLNTALEFQAIARVDRIGQEHETTVWLYIMEGTVEENIHILSERRRLAHIGGEGEKGKYKETEAISALESTESHLARLMSKDDDGEVIDKGDLWSCLFGSAAQA